MASTSRGSFIVIEGLDRSGKSTQAIILKEKLEESLGLGKVKLMKFPDRTTPIGKMIDSYLRSQSDLDDRAIHLLFSANRWEAASSIMNDLNDGITIVCDRYAFSGVSFSASKGLPYDWCVAPDVGLPAPDLVLFLDVSPEVAKSRGGYGDERYEKEDLQRRVRETFKRMREGVDNWIEVDAGKTLDEVTADIWSAVMPILDTKMAVVNRLWTGRTFS